MAGRVQKPGKRKPIARQRGPRALGGPAQIRQQTRERLAERLSSERELKKRKPSEKAKVVGALRLTQADIDAIWENYKPPEPELIAEEIFVPDPGWRPKLWDGAIINEELLLEIRTRRRSRLADQRR